MALWDDPRPLLAGWAEREKTVTASSAAAGHPASELTSPRLSRTWRSVAGALSGVTLRLDYGVAVPIDAAVIVGANFTTDATRRVRFGTTAGASDLGEIASGPAFDAAWAGPRTYAPPWGRMVVALPPARITARHVEFLITDAANPDGQLRAAYAFAEEAFPFTQSFNAGWRRPDEPLVEGAGLGFRRQHQILLTGLPQSEAYALLDLARSMGETGRALFIPWPHEPKSWLADALWGAFRGLPDIQALSEDPETVMNQSLAFREVDE